MEIKDYKYFRQKHPFEQKIRHHVSSQNYFKFVDLKNTPDTYPLPIEKVDWAEIFPNKLPPNILDVGCGKGMFLLSIAQINEEKNHLGVELRKYPVDWLNKVCKLEEIDNCRAINYSMVNGLGFIESNTIERLYYLFPDPWPKNRHKQRRAFNPDFLQETYRLLKEGGELCLATDCDYVDVYHKQLLEEFGKLKFRRPATNEWDLPLTNKERFCVEKNIEVYRWIATKTD